MSAAQFANVPRCLDMEMRSQPVQVLVLQTRVATVTHAKSRSSQQPDVDCLAVSCDEVVVLC
eukprot:1299846-Rhodomonas_salina.2